MQPSQMLFLRFVRYKVERLYCCFYLNAIIFSKCSCMLSVTFIRDKRKFSGQMRGGKKVCAFHIPTMPHFMEAHARSKQPRVRLRLRRQCERVICLFSRIRRLSKERGEDGKADFFPSFSSLSAIKIFISFISCLNVLYVRVDKKNSNEN